MQQYQFEKIYSQMEKEYGKIAKGDEDFHTINIFAMESNLLKVHRKFPSSNSRRLLEAIALVLFDIKSRCTGETFELDSFRNEDNARLEHALLMAFDPFTNEELHAVFQFPQIGHPCAPHRAGVRHIENIGQARADAVLIDERNALGAGLDPAAHILIPQFHAGAGGGVRALGVD